jgi:ribonuclease VapC
MIVDASAIVAILLDEREAGALAHRLSEASRRATHPISVYEAALAIARVSRSTLEEAQDDVASFVTDLEMQVALIGAPETAAALGAFARYGEGRHPARLNMGDCFSYACAKVRGMPLLYKGDDFARTDLA